MFGEDPPREQSRAVTKMCWNTKETGAGVGRRQECRVRQESGTSGRCVVSAIDVANLRLHVPQPWQHQGIGRTKNGRTRRTALVANLQSLTNNDLLTFTARSVYFAHTAHPLCRQMPIFVGILVGFSVDTSVENNDKQIVIRFLFFQIHPTPNLLDLIRCHQCLHSDETFCYAPSPRATISAVFISTPTSIPSKIGSLILL